MKNNKSLIVALLLMAAPCLPQAQQSDASEKHPLKGGLDAYLAATGTFEFNLEVKFDPALDPDLDDNGAFTLQSQPPSGTLATLITNYHLTFSRVIPLSREELKAMRGGKRHQADAKGFNRFNFVGLFYVQSPDQSIAMQVKIGKAFEQIDEVEYCGLESKTPPPPPVDIPPTTPDFTAQQLWLGPNPGSDLRYAWTKNAMGQGVTIRDIEDSWGKLDHEDFAPADIAYVLPSFNSTYDFHGISIAGMSIAQHNGYGVDGGTPSAKFRCYSFQTSSSGQNRPAAMMKMVADAAKGDIILLEMQSSNPQDIDGGGTARLCPADFDQAIWDLTKQATDAGVIVIGAGGNGGANLDGTPYAAYRARGDNGTIMVGAGSGDTLHTALSFSSYGAPVHIQGWGEKVVTTSTGSYANLANLPIGSPDGKQGYTGSFNGTSSGGGMTAAELASLQSYALLRLGRPLAPQEMRTILIATGTPQTGTRHVGPLPNLKKAIAWLDSVYTTDAVPTMIKNKVSSNGLFYCDGIIRYFVPGSSAGEKCTVTLLLFDLKGSRIATLVNDRQTPGYREISLREVHGSRTLAKGVYLCSLHAADISHTAKIVVK